MCMRACMRACVSACLRILFTQPLSTGVGNMNVANDSFLFHLYLHVQSAPKSPLPSFLTFLFYLPSSYSTSGAHRFLPGHFRVLLTALSDRLIPAPPSSPLPSEGLPTTLDKNLTARHGMSTGNLSVTLLILALACRIQRIKSAF